MGGTTRERPVATSTHPRAIATTASVTGLVDRLAALPRPELVVTATATSLAALGTAISLLVTATGSSVRAAAMLCFAVAAAVPAVTVARRQLRDQAASRRQLDAEQRTGRALTHLSRVGLVVDHEAPDVDGRRAALVQRPDGDLHLVVPVWLPGHEPALHLRRAVAGGRTVACDLDPVDPARVVIVAHGAGARDAQQTAGWLPGEVEVVPADELEVWRPARAEAA